METNRPSLHQTQAGSILAEELTGRQASSVRGRPKAAGFPTGKTVDGWDDTERSRGTLGPVGQRVRVPWSPMDLTTVIETRPGVRSGKPCFIGTRIAVYDVLEYLESGMTTEEIVADFPELTPEHVRAAIEFAALRERRLATA